MKTLLSKLILLFGAALTMSVAGTSARADLLIIPVGSQIVQPAGLGTVNTVLVMQTQGSSTNGFGSVSFNPNSNTANKKGDVVSGNQIVGGANNQTWSVTDLGIVNGNLCINMNINDPTIRRSSAGFVCRSRRSALFCRRDTRRRTTPSRCRRVPRATVRCPRPTRGGRCPPRLSDLPPRTGAGRVWYCT